MSRAEQTLKPYAPVIFDKNFDHIEKTDAIIKAMKSYKNQALQELKERAEKKIDKTESIKNNAKDKNLKRAVNSATHEIIAYQSVIETIEDMQDE